MVCKYMFRIGHGVYHRRFRLPFDRSLLYGETMKRTSDGLGYQLASKRSLRIVKALPQWVGREQY